MYTVLIMAKKTSDNMHEHYPALRNVIEGSNIGICPWIVSGNTVETALPELYDIVDNNKEWRAVIVMYDEDELGLPDAINPYDYYSNKNVEPENGMNVNMPLEESNDYPLIRLTHFLAGVPIPPPEYEKIERWPDENYDDNATSAGEPYIVYEIVGGEKGYEKFAKKYKDWNTQYTMDGLAPSEIILVKTRDVAFRKDTKAVQDAWKDHNESDSSEFWRKNLYPQNSRFLLYDIEKKGVMYEERDSFVFWMSVLTVATNKIDSNTLQPHKLYNLSVKINNKKLAELFQDSIKKLNNARYRLMRSLEAGVHNDEYDGIPDYELLVPVDFNGIEYSEKGNKGFETHLAGGISTEENNRWREYTINTYLEVSELIKNIDRELEMSALSFRDRCEYPHSVVRLLDKYTEEDLRYSVHDKYGDILKSQKRIPKGVVNYNDEMKDADEQVKKDISERMSGKQISVVIFGIMIVFLIFLLPAFYQDSAQNETIIIIAISIISIVGIGFLVVFLQRDKLRKHIRAFRNYYNMICSELDESAKIYKEFFGNVASHIHGSSYLKELDRLKVDMEKAVGVKKTHIGFIDEFKGRLSLWSSALRVPINLDAIDEILLISDKNDIDFYNLYSLSLGDYYKTIPLNDTGYPVETPFNFVDQLLIEREEVYDDI